MVRIAYYKYIIFEEDVKSISQTEHEPLYPHCYRNAIKGEFNCFCCRPKDNELFWYKRNRNKHCLFGPTMDNKLLQSHSKASSSNINLGVSKAHINNLNRFSSYSNTFRLYKRISEQYNDQSILGSVKQLVPDNVLKLTQNGQTLEPLLHWFKNDFMKWMPKEQQCTLCNRPMRVQPVDDNSATFRKTEIHMCEVCGSTQIFPRYDKILRIAETRIGRCSEWSMLFGGIVNSLSIQTRIVHDYLDHCWNESLINKKWVHIDSTLEYPISFDHPYYYEQNWGKKFEYVLAFSANSLEDVTTRYTQQWLMVQKRRGKKDKIEEFNEIYYRT